jgi:iron complex outermembrane recepter protein
LASLAAFGGNSFAQTPLPEIVVQAPSPIVRRAPPRPAAPRPAAPRQAPAGPAAPAAPAAPTPPPIAPVAIPASGTLPIVVDQFATVTVVPSEELRRNGASTMGDLLFSKPGITGSSFAPGGSSRPIIRGLDVNRVRIQENGIGGNGASDLGEDHVVPVEPIVTNQIEVIRGPATLRFGSQAIGGVVESVNNRIPEALPCRDNAPSQTPLVTKGGAVPYTNPQTGCVSWEARGNLTTVDNGRNGAFLLDTGKDNWAFHADVHARKSDDYRIPSYPYLVPPNPLEAPNATQPNAFNGKQPNSFAQSDGYALGGSYIFDGGYAGVAYTRFNSLYGIPGIDGENHLTRIDAHQDKVLTKGEWRAPVPFIDVIRFWGGATDYKHAELGLADPNDLASDGIRQIFTNKEQEGRVEVTLMPFNLRFAEMTTAIGVQGGHQDLTAPSPDDPTSPLNGLYGPNKNSRIAGYIFNELKFTPTTKAQLSGRIENVNLNGATPAFIPPVFDVATDPASIGPTTQNNLRFTPASAAVGLLQDLSWNMVASITAQHVERAPKPAELFSRGAHDATATFDIGNPNLKIEKADSIEVGLRRANAPVRFEITAYYTKFTGFIFRNFTGSTCDSQACVGPDDPVPLELNQARYEQRDATFRGGEFQTQVDVLPIWAGMFGVEAQADVVRATFTDGTNVPRIPPVRAGGGVFWRDDNWLLRTNLIHAWAHTDVEVTPTFTETPTAGYNLLKAEVSYRWRNRNPKSAELSEWAMGIVGDNLLNDDIRNSVSYTKDEVLMPGRTVKFFANVKY